MTPDYDGIIEAALVLAAALHINVAEIVLNDSRGRPRLILPVKAPEAPQAGTLNVPLEIIKVLREAGKPLTGVLVFEALLARGVRTSDRTVNGHLAELVKDGTLQKGTDGKGYRLPD